MIWPAPEVPFFYCEGRFFKAVLGVAGSFRHGFGYTREIEIRGSSLPPLQVHLVLDLDLADPRLSVKVPDLARLPLLHPFRHDGGAMKYRVISDDIVEILEMRGELTDEWPYANYPEHLSSSTFDLTEPQSCSREEFAEPLYQGISPEHFDHFIAVVPDGTAYGCGLWQEDGNVLVNAMFCFDPATRVVETYNECD
jgi:hypothetical protein